MVDNSAADCSISLRFSKEFEHMTRDLLHEFKVEGQGHSERYRMRKLAKLSVNRLRIIA